MESFILKLYKHIEMSENLNLSHNIRNAIIKAMKITKNNLEAAQKLGVCERTFYNLLKEHGLQEFKRTVIPLKNIEGNIILTGKPSPELIKVLNEMAELAFKNL